MCRDFCLNSETRDVFIAHRVMRGDGIAKQLTDIEQDIKKILGEYEHGFFNTPNLFENTKLPIGEEYILYPAGMTTFIDLATQESGAATMYNISATQDPISNNYQRFTVELIALIMRFGRIKVRMIEDVSNDVEAFIPVSVPYLKNYAREQMLPEPPVEETTLARLAKNTPQRISNRRRSAATWIDT
ncbi:hypothetical protein GQX73_g4252 [Xylaria multiplex]|uniref:Uncharacterized protein n=1 Tax=Xylaria multiplex TaxID=323545 RepID=A0A7C8MTU1_9PEZI|nr:hypothetical protein GQX73_g4252 [Xylaria multiplex]